MPVGLRSREAILDAALDEADGSFRHSTSAVRSAGRIRCHAQPCVRCPMTAYVVAPVETSRACALQTFPLPTGVCGDAPAIDS